MAIAVLGCSHHSMNRAAASLCLAVTGIDSPSGSPNEAPGPSTPGTSPSAAWPAMFDWLGSLAVGILPGPVASTIAFWPAVKLSNAWLSSSETDPGDTQPFLTASTSHWRALYPAESGLWKIGFRLSSKSWPPSARVSRYHGVTPPSVAAIGIAIGYWTPAALSFSASWPSSARVFGNAVIPAFWKSFVLYIETRKSFE